MLIYMLVAAVSAAQIGQVVTLPTASRLPVTDKPPASVDVGICRDGMGTQ
jgi:hypothetical protein